MATATTAITTNLCLDMIDFQVQLSMGHEFSACLTTDDRLYMWGKGNNGQLGNGYYVDSLEPALAKTPGNNPDIHWVSISCGEDHCVGITGDGPPQFDPNENTFVRERHAKDTALPTHHAEDLMTASLKTVLEGFTVDSLGGGGGGGGGETKSVEAAPSPATAPTPAVTPSTAPPLVAPPPAAPPPAAPPSIPTHWSYQDATGAVQGPFETSMMKAWYENEMIHWNLMVRDASLSADEPFVQLGTLYPDKTKSFQ